MTNPKTPLWCPNGCGKHIYCWTQRWTVENKFKCRKCGSLFSKEELLKKWRG